MTCPTYRYNPAIVAEAFATLGMLNPGRVFLGLGTGEALNEATAGGGWCAGDQAEAERGADLWRFQPKAWTEYVFNPDPVSIIRRARETVLLDQVVSMFVVSTNPEDHVQSIQELIDAGVTTVFIHSAQEDQPSVIDFFGQHVLPHVQRQQRAVSAGR